jgi:hypothetical protein
LALAAPGLVIGVLTLIRFRFSMLEGAISDLTLAIFRRHTDKSPTFRIHREMNCAQLKGTATWP